MDISSLVAAQSCLSSLDDETEHEPLLDSALGEVDHVKSQPTLIIKNLA